MSGFISYQRYSFLQEQDPFPTEVAKRSSEGFALLTRTLLVLAAFSIPLAIAVVVTWMV